VTVLSFPAVRELIYGGHMLAIGTASIAMSSALLLGKTPTPALLVMAYLFSFGAYMINRASEIGQDSVSNPQRTEYLSRRKARLPLIAGIAFALGYVLAAFSNLFFLVALIVPLVLAFLYSIGSKRFEKFFGAKRLKEKLLVKNLAISTGWSLIPLLVGLYFQILTPTILEFAGFVFLRLLVNTIFFDIRDVKADREFGVRTIPSVFGARKSYAVMNLIDFGSACYCTALLLLNLLPQYCIVLLALPAYSYLYRIAARKSANLGYYTDVVADAEYLFWGPLLLMGSLLI
jgi:4-hydroxybenzoate polyprenyltransferase